MLPLMLARLPEGAIVVICIAAAFPGIILIAVAVKLWEVRKAKNWPSAEGTVVTSTVKSTKKEPGDPGYDFSDTEVSNEPLVEYDFLVDGQKHRGHRVTIGEKTADWELEGILARYPVGTRVTVYYDPSNPRNAVLERELPAKMMILGLGCLLLFFIGGPLIAAAFYFGAVNWLTSHLHDPSRAPFVAASGGFAIVTTLFGWAFFRMTGEAARWPTVTGMIIDASVESYRELRDTNRSSRPSLMHKPSIVYEYEVNGRRFTGDRERMGVKISSTSSGLARRAVERYPIGSEVEVHYNPKSPGESVLYPKSRWHYLIWAVAALMYWLSWAVATGKI